MEKEILQFLNENDGIDYREMIDFFIEKFPIPNAAIYTGIIAATDTLNKKGFIEFNPYKENQWYKFLGNNVVADQTTNNFVECTFELFKSRCNEMWKYNFEIKITFDGKKALKDILFQELMTKTNKALKRSAKASISSGNQIEKATWVIAIATIVNVAVSTIPLFKHKDEIKLSPQQLQIQMPQSKAQSVKVQTKNDTSFAKDKKDALR